MPPIAGYRGLSFHNHHSGIAYSAFRSLTAPLAQLAVRAGYGDRVEYELL